MSFTFPSPDQFRKTIEERETLTDDQAHKLFKFMSARASGQNRVVKILTNSEFNLRNAERFLLDRGYDARIDVTIEGDLECSSEVLTLVIDLGKATNV